jgi:hypothetical protein
VSGVAGAQLAEQSDALGANRVLAGTEFVTDPQGGVSLGHELENLPFAMGQVSQGHERTSLVGRPWTKIPGAT